MTPKPKDDKKGVDYSPSSFENEIGDIIAFNIYDNSEEAIQEIKSIVERNYLTRKENDKQVNNAFENGKDCMKQKVKDFLDWCNEKSILNFKWSKIEDLYEYEQKKKELLK